MIWIINQNKKDQMGSSARYVTMPAVRTRVDNTPISKMASIKPGSLAQPQPTTKLLQHYTTRHLIVCWNSFSISHFYSPHPKKIGPIKLTGIALGMSDDPWML